MRVYYSQIPFEGDRDVSMSFPEKLSHRINIGIEYLLFIFGFSMAVLVAVQVFFRYVLNHSLFWSEELARYLLVWLTFLGASVAYYRNVHPGIDIFSAKLSPNFRRILAVSVHIASLFLFCVMMYYGCQFAYFIRLQISPALQLPKWIIFSIIPLSGLILTIHSLVFLGKSLTGTS